MKRQLLLPILLLFSIQSVSAQFGERVIIDETALGITEITTADIDNDGDSDILISQKYDNQNKISFYINDGIGNFGEQQIMASNIHYPLSLATGDFDGNGWKDVVTFTGLTQNGDLLLINNDEGAFAEPLVVDSNLYHNADIKVDDIDNDGDDDIILIEDISFNIYYNNGDATFTKVVNEFVTEFYDLEVIDIDGDGFSEVLIGSVNVLIFNNIEGTLVYDEDRTDFIGLNELILTMHLTDIDNDGDPDLISSNNTFDSKVSLNDGNGFFTVSEVLDTDISQCTSISSGDFDGDDDNDILTTYSQSGNVVWYENEEAVFGPQNIIITDEVPYTTEVCVSDLNSDGRPDIIWSEPLSIHLNDTPLSTRSILTTGVNVFPNPASDSFKIQTDMSGSLSVYNAMGQLLHSEIVIDAGDNKLDLNLSPQLYLIRIETANGIHLERLIVN